MEQIQVVVKAFEDKCAYCSSDAESLDCPFPLHMDAPNVPANILPICTTCKGKKKTNDIAWMYTENHIDQDRYINLLKFMLTQAGSDLIRDQIRMVTGSVADE